MLGIASDLIKAGKHLKPYQGLKQESSSLAVAEESRKTPKTLSGIETCIFDRAVTFIPAGKHLKPYQGLKLIKCE